MYEEYDSTRFLLFPLVVAAFFVGAAFADCLDGVLAMVADELGYNAVRQRFVTACCNESGCAARSSLESSYTDIV
jgi:hypothetical protein